MSRLFTEGGLQKAITLSVVAILITLGILTGVVFGILWLIGAI